MPTPTARHPRPNFLEKFPVNFTDKPVDEFVVDYAYLSESYRQLTFKPVAPRQAIVSLIDVSGMTMSRIENLRSSHFVAATPAEIIQIANHDPEIQVNARLYSFGFGNRWCLPKHGIPGNPLDYESPIFLYLDNDVASTGRSGRSLHTHWFGEGFDSLNDTPLRERSVIAVIGDASFVHA